MNYGIDNTEARTRYILFAGDNYYPSGGFNDMILMSEHLPEIMQVLIGGIFNVYPFDWWQIVKVTGTSIDVIVSNGEAY